MNSERLPTLRQQIVSVATNISRRNGINACSAINELAYQNDEVETYITSLTDRSFDQLCGRVANRAEVEKS